MFKINAGAGIRTLVDLRQQVLSLSPLAARAPPPRIKGKSLKTLKINYYEKMLRPGFEPESPARKARMIGRTTPTEHMINILIYTWAQWGLNPWPPGYEPGALPG